MSNPTETARRVLATTQADRALAHAHYFKLRDGIADDWIEGRLTDEAAEMDDDVCALAVTLAEVRSESARALIETQAALAAANARADLAYEEKALADREFVAIDKKRTDLLDELQAAEEAREAADRDAEHYQTDRNVLELRCDGLTADLARVTAERDEVRDRLSEVVPVLNRVIEERDAALATAERFAKYVDAVAPLAAPASDDLATAREQAETLRRERDEARDRLSEVVPVLDRVIEERDAAKGAEAAAIRTMDQALDEYAKLPRVEADLATARESVRELVAKMKWCRHTISNANEILRGEDEEDTAEVDAELVEIDALLAKHAAHAPTLDFRPLGGRPDPVTQQQHAQAHNAARLKGGES